MNLLKGESKMNVVDENGLVIGHVKYNSVLDHWDGNNFTDGSTGRFVLIHGTQWVDEDDYAEVVTDEEALQAILKSDSEELLDQPKFKRLKELYNKMDTEAEA